MSHRRRFTGKTAEADEEPGFSCPFGLAFFFGESPVGPSSRNDKATTSSPSSPSSRQRQSRRGTVDLHVATREARAPRRVTLQTRVLEMQRARLAFEQVSCAPRNLKSRPAVCADKDTCGKTLSGASCGASTGVPVSPLTSCNSRPSIADDSGHPGQSVFDFSVAARGSGESLHRGGAGLGMGRAISEGEGDQESSSGGGSQARSFFIGSDAGSCASSEVWCGRERSASIDWFAGNSNRSSRRTSLNKPPSSPPPGGSVGTPAAAPTLASESFGVPRRAASERPGRPNSNASETGGSVSSRRLRSLQRFSQHAVNPVELAAKLEERRTLLKKAEDADAIILEEAREMTGTEPEAEAGPGAGLPSDGESSAESGGGSEEGRRQAVLTDASDAARGDARVASRRLDSERRSAPRGPFLVHAEEGDHLSPSTQDQADARERAAAAAASPPRRFQPSSRLLSRKPRDSELEVV